MLILFNFASISVFIDRKGEVFDSVLEFLRDGTSLNLISPLSLSLDSMRFQVQVAYNTPRPGCADKSTQAWDPPTDELVIRRLQREFEYFQLPYPLGPSVFIVRSMLLTCRRTYTYDRLEAATARGHQHLYKLCKDMI